MIGRAVILLAALTLPAWWRETNSHAANARGMQDFQGGNGAAAVTGFQRANEIAPSPRSAFNLGTAEIATKEYDHGRKALEPAVKDRAFKADALFNRGNSSLDTKALDQAIADYSEALRTDPHHAGAKRNLEIALRQKEQQKKQGGGGGGGQQGKPTDKPTPGQPQDPKPREGDFDTESLLRSVKQQEEEELRRMKSKAVQRRVGW